MSHNLNYLREVIEEIIRGVLEGVLRGVLGVYTKAQIGSRLIYKKHPGIGGRNVVSLLQQHGGVIKLRGDLLTFGFRVHGCSRK